MGERAMCCEVCERNPTCGNDCGSCGAPDDTCGQCGIPKDHHTDLGAARCEGKKLRADLAAAIARAEKAEAQAAVRGGEWCKQNRAEGRGPCGACAWCCQQMRIGREADDLAWRKRWERERLRAEKAEAQLACGERWKGKDRA